MYVSQEFLVLAHVLCGHLDGAVFRYLLLLASLVDCMPWSSIKEFSPWVALVYPSLQVVCVCVCGCVRAMSYLILVHSILTH